MEENESLPRFVVLEHVWNGIHWDLMLEAGEILRTWAIDSPIVVGESLSARALADHRKAYLDYEGPVSGERGHVRRIASGTYQVLEWRSDRVRVILQGSQLVGELILYRTNPSSGVEGSISNRLDVSEPWKLRLGKVD